MESVLPIAARSEARAPGRESPVRTIAGWRPGLSPRRRPAPARGLAGWALALALALGACGGEPPPPPTDAGAEPEVRAEAAPPEEPGPPARRRGLWVLCEGTRRVLEDPGRIEQLVADARALGATDLFVQVYRGGRAWFASDRADATPFREIKERTGHDPLATLLTQAHAAGLAVHAWANVLSLHTHDDAPILSELGRGAVHVDRHGRSMLDYPGREVPEPDGRWYRMGTRGFYLDPGAPGVSDWLADTFAELVERYPALDGLHLDYIRHPDVLPFVPGSRFGVGLDFGYGEATRARFARETGLAAPLAGRGAHANRWDDWRREQVTALVAEIRSRARAHSPDLALSVAGASHADRAYLSLFQDWRGWLQDGLVEFVVVMAYTLDDRLLGYQLDSFSGSPQADRIWAGLGTWLFASRPERALAQIEAAGKVELGGDALFSYDAIADAPALREALARQVAGAGPPAEEPDGAR